MFRLPLTLSCLFALAACGGSGPAAEDEAPESSEVADTTTMPDSRMLEWLAANYGDMGPVLYNSGEADLDGDGTNELLVYVGGPSLCGTGGCNLVVLRRNGQELETIGDISVSQLPVGVFESSTNGWRDLAVTIYGGGIEAGVAKVPFEESAYAGNPTVPPAELSEEAFETVIDDEQLVALD